MYSGLDSLTGFFKGLRSRLSRKRPTDSPLPELDEFFDEEFEETSDEDSDPVAEETIEKAPEEREERPSRPLIPSLAREVEVPS